MCQSGFGMSKLDYDTESTGLAITKRPTGYERPATFTDSCGHLDEHLGPAPGHLERHLQPSADVDGRAGLERHGVGRLEATGHLDLRPGGGDLIGRPADQDHERRPLAAGTPEVIAVVGAARRGQAVPPTVVVDRAGLTVVPRHDLRIGALLFRQRAVDARNLLGQLVPAEAVGKVLWEWTEAVLLADRGRESEGALVTDERLHGQHRKGGTEVVGLAVLHGQDHEGGDEHDTQGAEPPSGPPEK